MEAPKCKLCGERHWGSFCAKSRKGSWLPKVPPKSKAEEQREASDAITPSPKCMAPEPKQVSNPPVLEQSAPAPETVKPKRDRNAYQRAYMAKRRAEQKAKT